MDNRSKIRRTRDVYVGIVSRCLSERFSRFLFFRRGESLCCSNLWIYFGNEDDFVQGNKVKITNMYMKGLE